MMYRYLLEVRPDPESEAIQRERHLKELAPYRKLNQTQPHAHTPFESEPQRELTLAGEPRTFYRHLRCPYCGSTSAALDRLHNGQWQGRCLNICNFKLGPFPQLRTLVRQWRVLAVLSR
jgi:hypothetical protein